MTKEWVAGMLLVTCARAASAQTMQRFEVGLVLRLGRVTEDQAVMLMPVFGMVGSARLSKFWGIEGEITQADRHEFGFSRDGISEQSPESAAPNGSSG